MIGNPAPPYGTKPVLAHIANGMYGAIVVEPPAGVLPKADRDCVPKVGNVAGTMSH